MRLRILYLFSRKAYIFNTSTSTSCWGWQPSLSSVRGVNGALLRFLISGYKYRRSNYCKRTQSNTKPFWLQPQTLGVGVKVDLDKTFNKSSCIGWFRPLVTVTVHIWLSRLHHLILCQAWFELFIGLNLICKAALFQTLISNWFKLVFGSIKLAIW